jgi:hypothetical protein
MNKQGFSLKPFLATSTFPDIKITGKIARSSNTISISYALFGLLAELVIPALSDKPARKDTLWEETCFELVSMILINTGSSTSRQPGTGMSIASRLIDRRCMKNWHFYLFRSSSETIQTLYSLT